MKVTLFVEPSLCINRDENGKLILRNLPAVVNLMHDKKVGNILTIESIVREDEEDEEIELEDRFVTEAFNPKEDSINDDK